MTSSNVVFTKKEYHLVARKKGIKEPQNMSTEELLNALSRYDRHKRHRKLI